MTHPTTFRHQLWNALRRVYRVFRRAVARSTEHEGAAIVVPIGAADGERLLGGHYFAPNWEFSYYERGENLNLARVEYDQTEHHGHVFEWWQTHVRGWAYRADDGRRHLRLRPHYELEPTEHDQDHVDGVGLDVERGVDEVAAILDAAGLPYERFEDLPSGAEGGDAARPTVPAGDTGG